MSIGNYVPEDSVSFRKKIDPGTDQVPRRHVPDTPGKSIEEINAQNKLVSDQAKASADTFREPSPTPRFDKVSLVKVIKMPRHLYIPENGYIFDQYGSVSVPTGSVETTICSYTIPSGMEGWIKSFGHDLTTALDCEDAWLTFIWYLKINNTTFLPYGDITRQIGTMLENEMSSVLKYINEGDVIKVSTKNSGATAIMAYARFKGWFYPKSNR